MSLLYAQNAVATQPQQNPIAGFIPLILLFIIFYFFLIRPQKKKADEHKQMVDNLQIGDKIITAGGVYGVVDGFKTDNQQAVYVKIAENTKILIEKYSISKILK